MAEFVAERTRHAATTRIKLLDRQTGDALQGPDRARGSHERLLLAMPVEQDGLVQWLKIERGNLRRIGDEGVHHPRDPRDGLGIVPEPEVLIFVDQGEKATWLAAEDRRPFFGLVDQLRDILLRELASVVKEPLRDRRPSATAKPREFHLVSRRFENLDRCLAHIWRVVSGETVVEEDHSA